MHRRAINPFILISATLLFLSGEVVHAAFPVKTSQAVRQVWNIQRVDDVHRLTEKMGDHAAVYDSAGTLHVTYGSDHLYYARCVGTSCTVEVVDSTDFVGMYASLALDSHGHPHIAYYDTGLLDTCDDEKVKYAAWNGSQWRIDVVDQGCLGVYPSIAVDAQDAPHISYFDEVSDELRLADWENNSWHAYTPYWLPSFGFSGHPSSLLSDAQGRLHLAFIAGASGGGGTVWYTRKVEGGWEPLVQVDSQPGASRLAMVLDSAGAPHLAYNHSHFDSGLNDTVSKVRYKRFDGSAWLAHEEVASMEYLGWISLLVGTDGYPRLVYKADGAVAAVRKTSAGWGTPAAIPNTDGTERMYLGQASATTLGMSFYSGGKLHNVRKGPESSDLWTVPIEIDSTGHTGSHIAMAASQTGDLHVVYTDWREKELRYAHRPAGGAWQIETVLETGDNLLIRAADIDLDTNGRPNIVYQEYNESDQRSALKYLFWSGSVWGNMGAVHEPTHNGCMPSLELDGSNTIYIAYNDCDYVHDNLMLAIWDGTWHYQTVDPAQDTSSASLVVNDLGYFYISYTLLDYPNSKVRFARKEGSVNWTNEDVAIGTMTNTSLVLDSAGRPRIAYVVTAGMDYISKLSYWDGQQWLVDTVAETMYWSESRLAIDEQDRLHLAYACQYRPCYALKDGSEWAVTDPVDRPPADPDEDFGTTRSLAIGLGTKAMPVIVYEGELDLKAAELEEELLVFLPLVVR